MTVSVNTNKSALIALQNMNANASRLGETQNRISTGLKVQGAKDNAAVHAIAQAQRADVSSLGAVKSGLDRATSIADVSLAAGQSISDLMTELRQKAVAAADPSATAETRTAYNDEYQSLLAAVNQFANGATFDGVNVLNGSIATALNFLADANAAQTISITPQNMTTAAAPGLALAGTTLTTTANATAALTAVDAAIASVATKLSSLGAQAKQIDNHKVFVEKLVDALEVGVGNLVDADMAKESAKLQALQVQQQLGAQALSIANQGPQVILSLFRGG